MHVNWLAPVKVRRTLIGGSSKMIVYDDLEPSEKIKVYDKGIRLTASQRGDTRYQMLVGYRTGDMWAPQLDMTEALRLELSAFRRVHQAAARPPMTDGQAGLRVVRILEAATFHGRRGRVIELDLRRSRCPHDSVSRSESAVPEHQGGNRRARSSACSRAPQFVLGPEVAAFEGEFASLLRQPKHAIAVNYRHERPAPRAARRRRRPGRRSDHHAVHLRRHRLGDPLHRRDAGLRRHRPRVVHHGPGADRGGDHAADEGDPAGAPLRPAGRHGSDPGDRRATA